MCCRGQGRGWEGAAGPGARRWDVDGGLLLPLPRAAPFIACTKLLRPRGSMPEAAPLAGLSAERLFVFGAAKEMHVGVQELRGARTSWLHHPRFSCWTGC